MLAGICKSKHSESGHDIWINLSEPQNWPKLQIKVHTQKKKKKKKKKKKEKEIRELDLAGVTWFVEADPYFILV